MLAVLSVQWQHKLPWLRKRPFCNLHDFFTGRVPYGAQLPRFSFNISITPANRSSKKISKGLHLCICISFFSVTLLLGLYNSFCRKGWRKGENAFGTIIKKAILASLITSNRSVPADCKREAPVYNLVFPATEYHTDTSFL